MTPKATTATAAAPDLAVLQARVDELIEERAGLPDRRRQALRDGDQQAFFDVERRMIEIDAELLDAERETLAARVEAAWAQAERLHAAEPALAEASRTTRADFESIAHWRNDPDPRAGEAAFARRRLEIAQAGEKATAAYAELRDAIEDTNAAVAEAEQFEDQLVALTGRRPAGDGIRRIPAPVAATVMASHPDPGIGTVTVPAGEVPPRWIALRITSDAVWQGPDEDATAPTPQNESDVWRFDAQADNSSGPGFRIHKGQVL
jgi:hypothetical protein